MSSSNSHVPALPGGPVRTCWTYLRFSPCSLFELRKVPHLRASMYEMADLTSWRVALAGRQIYDRYGVTWAGKRLLDIGCGQILGYTLPLAMANTVTGIDTELPLRRPILPAIWRTMRRSGLHRTIKSAVAAVLGQARLFEEGLRRATGFRGPFDYDLRCMDATKLEFPDASFEGVCSFSVLEHLADPRSALREMHRVLQPGGVCYLDLHLYTAIHGDHDPRGAAVPPWNHLRSPGR